MARAPPGGSGERDNRRSRTARALAASTGPTEAPEPRFQSAYQRTLVLACVDAMQANEPEVILPLVEEMTRVAAGGGIEASLQASLRRGLGSHAPGSPRRSRGAARCGVAGGAPPFLSGLALDIGAWLAQTSYMRGRLIEAQEVADECEALAERIGEPSRPAMLVRMWGLIATISAGDHRAGLAGLQAMCEDEQDPHHRIPLHQAIARWRSRLNGAASADEVHARIAAGREGFGGRTMHPMRHSSSSERQLNRWRASATLPRLCAGSRRRSRRRHGATFKRGTIYEPDRPWPRQGKGIMPRFKKPSTWRTDWGCASNRSGRARASLA